MATRSPWEESVLLTLACGERVVSGLPEPCKPAREGSSQSALLAHPHLTLPSDFCGVSASPVNSPPNLPHHVAARPTHGGLAE